MVKRIPNKENQMSKRTHQQQTPKCKEEEEEEEEEEEHQPRWRKH